MGRLKFSWVTEILDFGVGHTKVLRQRDPMPWQEEMENLPTSLHISNLCQVLREIESS